MKSVVFLKTKLLRVTAVICAAAVLFSTISILAANNMRKTAQNIYEHPYTVTNTARGMRSRLLDMKRFIGIFLRPGCQSEENLRNLLEERYALQKEAIGKLFYSYLGPKEDIAALRSSFDALMEGQQEALQSVKNSGGEENGIQRYIDTKLYPLYDRVYDSLERIIAFSDSEIRSLTEKSDRAAVIFIAGPAVLTALIIFLTLHLSKVERKHKKKLTARERELQDALALAQRAGEARKDFLSRMSHEIKTPINVIIGMTAIAGAHLEDRGRIRDCLTKISYSSDHLLSLVNDVLDMSEIEAGKLTVNHDPFRLEQLTESILSAANAQTKSRGRSFELHIDGALQEVVVGDFMRVNQILLNLISNAIKFTPRDGKIQLRISRLSQINGSLYLRFEVRDTGIGMDQGFLDGGTDLGLSITYNLVELLGGSISVNSKSREGTVFTVVLPFELPEKPAERKKWEKGALKVLVVDDEGKAECVESGREAVNLAQKASSEKNELSQRRFEGKRFLLVEDNILNKEIASELLKQTGAEIDCAENGKEAVDRFVSSAAGWYDLILMDVQMPIMNGLAASEEIRKSSHPDAEKILIVAMTANAFRHDVEAAYAAGMNGHIVKPVEVKTLYQTIGKLFEPFGWPGS